MKEFSNSIKLLKTKIMGHKIFYVVSKSAISGSVKGVYTNKKDLFDDLIKIPKIEKIEFKHVLDYEKKTFNYSNVLNLLKTLNPDDSCHFKFIMEKENPDDLEEKQKAIILEITVKTQNTLSEII